MLPAHRPTPRHQAGHRGGRRLHPDHHLALLSDPTVRYQDLGPGFYDTRINAERRKRNHIRQLEALGYKVSLEPCRLTTTIPTRTRLAALRRRLPPAYAPSISD